MEDKRYNLAKERFESLSNEELQRVIDNQDLLLFDTFNYNEGKFCPIAIAMNLHTLPEPTDALVKEEISRRFNPTNIFKGTAGDFYTINRKDDVIGLCKEILKTRYDEQS